jgi:predicted acylesterase/phospholipase RssA
MTIKHLVISGGGPNLIQTLGAIQHLEKNKIIDLNNIETIYGTSAGAIVGTLLCMKYDWETINDYIIKRPWQDVFKVTVEKILEAYTKKGIFGSNTIEKCFKPLLDAKDISMTVTLEEFYNYSNIELHFFTFEINGFKIEDISYLTHPTVQLLTAIQMTCSLPVLVTPVCIDDKCYIDGGIMCNYPLNHCVESGKNIHEIMGFKNKYEDTNTRINSESTLLDFIMSFLFNVIYSFSRAIIQPFIQNEIICKTNLLSIDYLKSSLSNIETRKTLFTQGEEAAANFIVEITKIKELSSKTDQVLPL